MIHNVVNFVRQIYSKAPPLGSAAGLGRARGLAVEVSASEGRGGGGRGGGTGGGRSSDFTGARLPTPPHPGGPGGGRRTTPATWPWAGCDEPPRTTRQAKAIGLYYCYYY